MYKYTQCNPYPFEPLPHTHTQTRVCDHSHTHTMYVCSCTHTHTHTRMHRSRHKETHLWTMEKEDYQELKEGGDEHLNHQTRKEQARNPYRELESNSRTVNKVMFLIYSHSYTLTLLGTGDNVFLSRKEHSAYCSLWSRSTCCCPLPTCVFLSLSVEGFSLPWTTSRLGLCSKLLKIRFQGQKLVLAPPAQVLRKAITLLNRNLSKLS